jgi:hypothetical protein
MGAQFTEAAPIIVRRPVTESRRINIILEQSVPSLCRRRERVLAPMP